MRSLSGDLESDIGQGQLAMIRIFGQMLKLPVTVFVFSMEMVFKTMQGVQKIAEQGIDYLIDGTLQTTRDRARVNEDLGNEKAIPTTGPISHSGQDTNGEMTQKEDSEMNDQDLSGDDLKYVSYSILFTKADLETTLEEQKEQLVTYSTDGASYAGLKISDYFVRVTLNQVPRPQVWIDNNYPPKHDPINPKIWELPPDDRRYVTFVYQVDRRLGRNTADYPKQQVQVLREIRDKIPPPPPEGPQPSGKKQP